MNRISRRSATEVAETLLEIGRTQPELHYDVELGLARHHHWVRSDAPMPEWANASVGTAATSLVAVMIKTIVSVMLMGALAAAAWHARGHLQPSAATIKQPLPDSQPMLAALPSVREVTTSEAWLARTPLPVSDQDLPSNPPAHRTVRADAPDKHTTRVQRIHRELTAARAASARDEQALRRADAADAPAAHVEPAASTTTQANAGESVPRATGHEVAAAPERKPISARPGPEPQAQAPGDLVEMQQVATAERLLERSPERALALVHQGDQRFARGYFQQERAYIAIMALIRLGRSQEARARAASFAKQFPALPYGARIRSALEAREAAAPGAALRDAVP
jgi:hypothetical protein